MRRRIGSRASRPATLGVGVIVGALAAACASTGAPTPPTPPPAPAGRAVVLTFPASDEPLVAWANRSERLAVARTAPGGGQVLTIVEPASGREAFRHAFAEGQRVSALAWSDDDTALLLASAGEDQTHELLALSLADGRLTPALPALERLYAGIAQLAHEPGTRRLAIVFYAEGHTDLAVYDGERTLLQTQVHPAQIAVVGWQDGALYVESDAALEDGLEYHGEEPGERRTYRVDPATGQVVVATAPPEVLEGTSPGGRYRVEVVE